MRADGTQGKGETEIGGERCKCWSHRPEGQARGIAPGGAAPPQGTSRSKQGGTCHECKVGDEARLGPRGQEPHTGSGGRAALRVHSQEATVSETVSTGGCFSPLAAFS